MIAVIGDIHGCFNTLVDVFNKVKIKYGHIPIYCVGDLVDRGQKSFEVMNFIINEGIRVTPGNHDIMFAHGILGQKTEFSDNWVYNGMVETINSYQGHFETLITHANFILSQPLFYNLNDAFISHAGISTYYEDEFHNGDFFEKLEKYIKRDYYLDRGVLWTRDELLNIGKLQVVGHTKHNKVEFDEEANAVIIDTGCYQGNKLSCVVLHNNQILDIISSNTIKSDIM